MKLKNAVVFACSLLVFPACTMGQTASARTPSAVVDDVWSKAEAQYGVPPVPARIDRVWKAIPGLNGWTLDREASIAATTKAGDGKTHLVWRSIPPSVTLGSLHPEPIYRGPSTDKSVSLMVNVSWGEAYLPSMLNTFAKERVRATFFLDGDWVRKNPDVARKIAAAGHAIGSHGSGHPDFRRLSVGGLQAQMSRTGDVIQQIVGCPPVAFAPPSGAFDNRTVAMAHRFGLYTILWTVDTIDWRKPPSEVIVERVKRGVSPGALVLMHPTAPTASALPQMIRVLKSQGYQFKTMDQVVAERRPVPPTVLP